MKYHRTELDQDFFHPCHGVAEGWKSSVSFSMDSLGPAADDSSSFAFFSLLSLEMRYTICVSLPRGWTVLLNHNWWQSFVSLGIYFLGCNFSWPFWSLWNGDLCYFHILRTRKAWKWIWFLSPDLTYDPGFHFLSMERNRCFREQFREQNRRRCLC